MPRSIPLSAQLLIVFVGLVVATTVALSVAAYRSSLQTLVTAALRDVSAIAHANERTLDELLELRQRRLEGFLTSVEQLCGEPAGTRGFGWSEDCVRIMIDQMRITEGASGVLLTFQGKRLRVSGAPVADGVPHPDARALVVPRGRRDSDLLMRAVRGAARMPEN